MSLHWTFSAFPAGTFASVFGKTRSEAVTEFLALSEWAGTDGGEDLDILATQELARRVLTQGLDYSGSSVATASQLDRIVALALSSEGQDALGLSELEQGGIDGPDHMWAGYGKRALGKDGGQVLAWLEQGRRWKTLQPCADVWGAHLVLSPDEVSKLLAELRAVLERGGAEKGYREHVEEFVIPELEVLAGEGLELVGSSG